MPASAVVVVYDVCQSSLCSAGDPVPFALTPKVTNERSLEAAVKYASDFLNKAVKPVLVGGVKMRWPGKAQNAFIDLSEAGVPSSLMLLLIKHRMREPEKQLDVAKPRPPSSTSQKQVCRIAKPAMSSWRSNCKHDAYRESKSHLYI